MDPQLSMTLVAVQTQLDVMNQIVNKTHKKLGSVEMSQKS